VKTVPFLVNNVVEAHEAQKPFEAHSMVIDLPLTEAQTSQLAPLVHTATADHKNVLFVATVAPFWSVEEGQTIWRFQVVPLPARDGFKVIKLIRKIVDDQNPLLPDNNGQ
jgi:hypothetical protein